MLLGFSDQDAFDRVMADARSHFRRTSSAFSFETGRTRELVEDGPYPAAWLSHGGIQFGPLSFGGMKEISSGSIGGRRCLIPSVGDDGETLLMAGIWVPFSAYDLSPKTFQLVQVVGEFVPVAACNWDNWLNPERDVRPMLRRSQSLVVPGQHALAL